MVRDSKPQERRGPWLPGGTCPGGRAGTRPHAESGPAARAAGGPGAGSKVVVRTRDRLQVFILWEAKMRISYLKCPQKGQKPNNIFKYQTK